MKTDLQALQDIPGVHAVECYSAGGGSAWRCHVMLKNLPGERAMYYVDGYTAEGETPEEAIAAARTWADATLSDRAEAAG